jgi:orotate phosphoribosyltransferase
MKREGAGFVAKRSRSELQARIDDLCIETGGPFTLSTGEVSDFYFDCKRAVLQGDVLCLIAEELLREATDLPEMPDAIGGLSIGADFLVAATIQLAAQRRHPMLNGCVVRKERKDHGTRNHIENAQPDGTRILVVDDVITTGNSTGIACDRLLEAKNRIVGIVGLIDREQGGVESLVKKYGVPVTCLFKSSDFPRLTQANERNCEPLVATA